MHLTHDEKAMLDGTLKALQNRRPWSFLFATRKLWARTDL